MNTSDKKISAGEGNAVVYKAAYNKQVYKLCLLGATNQNIADFFEISEATLGLWMQRYPRFATAVKKGQQLADMHIAEGLYERARGCTITVQRAVKLTTKRPVLDEHGNPTRNMEQTEEVQIVDLRQQLPPDPASIIFWLKNRRPRHWNDKQHHEHTGKDGKALERQVIIINGKEITF